MIRIIRKIWNWLRSLGTQPIPALSTEIQLQKIAMNSVFLQRMVDLSLYTFSDHHLRSLSANALLILNDGQDLAEMELDHILEDLARQQNGIRLLVVGVHANADRMQDYGTATVADYAGRGSRAGLYSRFVLEELLPRLEQNYYLTKDIRQRGIAGWSLGGLSAFDIAWQHPYAFGRVGVFSGALWWRSAPFRPELPDADRILHELVSRGPLRADMRFWFQTGTLDETSDRNSNGVIDSIDDTMDLIRALEHLGYQNQLDIVYREVEGGEHNVPTWRGVMPEFLRWFV